MRLIKIKQIKYLGKQDVYNMEVKDHHNFSVEGGFIIHNCLDSLRYLCNTLYPIKSTRSPISVRGL